MLQRTKIQESDPFIAFYQVLPTFSHSTSFSPFWVLASNHSCFPLRGGVQGNSHRMLLQKTKMAHPHI